MLLPSGLQDILSGEAASESRLTIKLLKNFTMFGFEQVKPPLMEFEKSLESGSGKYLKNQIFKALDPISQEIMGVRPDMTTQIARIATTRMKENARPLRLCYAGQVLRVQGEGLLAERQLSQAGIEIIGNDSPKSSAEAVFIAINSLQKIGISDLSVDFSLPRLSAIIMDALDTPEDSRSHLLAIIEKKDISSIENSGDKSSDIFCEIIQLASKGSSLDAAETLDKLSSILKSHSLDAAIIYCQRLKEVVAIVKSYLKDINITIDPLERRGFEYHTGVSFSFFSKNSNEELGRGGSYIIDTDKEDAVGFTLSINSLKRCTPLAEEKPKIFIEQDVNLSETENLREQGYITIHALDGQSPAKLGCGYSFVNGKIITR